MNVELIKSLFLNIESVWKTHVYPIASADTSCEGLLTLFLLWETEIPGYMYTLAKYGKLTPDELNGLIALRPSYKPEIARYLNELANKGSKIELLIYLSDRLVEVIHEFASTNSLK